MTQSAAGNAVPTEEVVLTRTFDAPRRNVFRAFTEPEQLAAWWGPEGYSVPVGSVEADYRPGGYQRLVMVDDNNPDWQAPLDWTLAEYVDGELIHAEGEFPGIPGMQDPTLLRLRIAFRDQGPDRTLVEVRQSPYTPAAARMARLGWESSFTKLEKLLAA